MSMMQEKMYMDVDDVCAILGVSKTYAYSLMREYNKELKAKGYIVVAVDQHIIICHFQRNK